MKLSHDALSDNLKRIREERSLSLDALSEISGVSKSMLRQIEIGQSSPTMATIWKIANGLKLPFTAFFVKKEPEIRTGRFRANDPVTGETQGSRVYPLIPFAPDRTAEIYFVEIDEGIGWESEGHQGNPEESLFLISGTLEISIQGETRSVGPEEYISFPASTAHSYRNSGEGMVKAMMQITYAPEL